ncbi:MAG TPA: hypothetical protein VGC54_05780, partial [Planctomycetota bacterium]
FALLQGVRRFGIRLPLLTNPAIDFSGLAGERKSALLEALRESVGAGLPAWTPLPRSLTAEERFTRAKAWMAEHGLDYPVILKPDVAQRGSGLRKVAGDERLRHDLEHGHYDQLLQEYVDLPAEYGVSWRREPGAAHGTITGITRKDFPKVVGDGRRTLEQLVLKHPRQRLWAQIILRRLGAREFDKPAKGVVVQLAAAGNHAQGTTFRDGSQLATEALRARLEDWLAGLGDGFHIGRFDLRARGDAALQAGEGLRLIELNGVAGEPTHAYDPTRNPLASLRILCAHWGDAFRIGALMRRRGARPPRWRAVVRAMFQAWREQRRHLPAD